MKTSSEKQGLARLSLPLRIFFFAEYLSKDEVLNLYKGSINKHRTEILNRSSLMDPQSLTDSPDDS